MFSVCVRPSRAPAIPIWRSMFLLCCQVLSGQGTSIKIRRPLQGVEHLGIQEQGLQLPSIQPAVFKPSQPASNTSQPASKPANLASEPGQPSQPSRPASQPAQPAQPASQSTRRKGFSRGPQLAPYVASQVWKKHYDSLQILENASN